MLELNLFLLNNGNIFLDKFFLLVSYLITDIPLVAVLCYVYWCINKDKGIRTGFILLNGMLFNFIVKDIFKAERPYVKNSDIVNKDVKFGYGYSFPSNHSQLSMSLLFSVKRYFNIIKFFIPLLVLTLLIGFSRIYLGVHSIIDVLIGFLLGFFIVKISGNIIDKIMERKKYWYGFLFIIPGIIGIVFFNDHDSLKITYLYLGFLIGFLVENKYIGYKIPKKIYSKIINYLIGIIGIAAIYLLIENDIKYFVLGFYITFIAPLLFNLRRKINENRKNKQSSLLFKSKKR